MGVKGLFFFLLPTMMLWRIETGQREMKHKDDTRLSRQERYDGVEMSNIAKRRYSFRYGRHMQS